MVEDMLVKLYDLPEKKDYSDYANDEIEIKRPLTADKSAVVKFAGTFGDRWACECETAFSRIPVSCFVAVKDKKVVGFACYDVTAPDYFGPTGVSSECRHKGIGTALLFKCLCAMAHNGYAYAIIGCVDAARDFYKKQVGAISIPNSFPGYYKGLLDR